MNILDSILAELTRLNANLEKLNSAAPAQTAQAIDAASAEKPATGKKKPTEKPATPPTPAEPTLTYDADVKPALQRLMAAKGKPALAELLKSFGAANGQALKPEQFSDVIAKAEAATADTDPL